MKEARPTTRTSELLFEREVRGVRTLSLVRGLFALVFVPTDWVIGLNLFEKLATTAMGAAVLVAVGVSLVLLARGIAVQAVGLAGCAIDIAILGVLPVIWYKTVGISEVAPAFLLKTQITAITLVMVVLNALAIRPLYPIVVAAGGILVHLALLAYALRDPRTVTSSDFADSAMGAALSVELVATSMLLIALTGVTLGYLTFIARRTIVQGVRLEVANNQLGRYFSPGVVARISKDADTLHGIGGRTQKVAVMFCDIRDFTTMTEQLPPADVVDFLSLYHARMLAEIFAHGGTIDKFIGDAIMVTFGTPDPGDDDAERAVRAGLAMNAALARLNAECARQKLPEIRHGIGIHYGPVIAGNIGTEDRLEYTVIGDTVNVASRIQDACKTVGQSLLISEAVKSQLPADIQATALAEQRVKGRKAPVRLYAVN